MSAFPKREKVDLATVYPGAGEEAIDLLHKILVFNPYFRVTLDECLDHPFFKKVRKSEKEMLASEAVKFDWEKESLDKKKLREYFVEEIRYFKEKRSQS